MLFFQNIPIRPPLGINAGIACYGVRETRALIALPAAGVEDVNFFKLLTELNPRQSAPEKIREATADGTCFKSFIPFFR